MIFSNKQGNSMRKDSCLNKQHCNNYSIIQIKKEGEKRKESVSEYKVKSFSHVWLFVTPWIVAYQALLSMEFSRQEYWNGLPFPSLGDLPNLGIKPRSPALQAVTLPSEPPGKPYPIRISTLFWSFLYAFFSFLYFFPTPPASTLWSVFLFYVKFSLFFLLWSGRIMDF